MSDHDELLNEEQQPVILAVDDQPSNLVALHDVLKHLGVPIIGATSGEEALRLLLKHKVALCLLDIQMPEMDGFEVARLIREDARQGMVPIIFITAIYTSKIFRIQGLEAGAIDYLTKPYDPVELVTKVRNLLNQDQLRREQTRLQMQLQQMQDQQHRFFTVANVLLAMINAAGKFVRVNNSWTKLLGWQEEDLLDMPINEFVHEEDREAVSLLTGQHPQQNLIIRMRGNNGNWYVLSWSTTPDKPSNIWFTSARDVTDLAERQQALQRARDQAESLSNAKSRFLSVLSHEIRTPLNGIIGLSDELLERKLDQNSHEFLQMIHGCGLTLLDLLNNVLDLTQLEARRLSVKAAPIKLEDGLNHARNIGQAQCRTKGLSWACIIDTAVPEVIAVDGKILDRILVNLINNACKFTSKGGVELQVRWEADETGKKDHGRLIFDVIDTGIGISKEDQQSILEPFVQAESGAGRHFDGSGLGLALVQEMVQLINGQLLVRSELGKGSTFTVLIPATITDRIETAKITRKKAKAPDTVNWAVLIVDDDEINRLVNRHLLNNRVAHIDAADGGEQALKMVEQHPYDLILMDWAMPGMDGLETTRRIRQLEKQNKERRRKILGLSAHGQTPENIEQCMQAGMDGMIGKPATWDMLIDALRGPPEFMDDNTGSDEQRDPFDLTPLTPAEVWKGLYRDFPADVRVQLFATMRDTWPERIDKLRTIAIDDPEVQQFAHQFKGAARSCGLQDVLECATDLESCLKAKAYDQNVDRLRHRLADLLQDYLRLIPDKESSLFSDLT